MAKKPGRNSAIATERESIRSAGALQFLLDIVQGKPAPVRDAAGRVVDWTDVPDLPLRVSTATALVKKVLPDLQAQSIDLQTSGEGVLRLVLADGVTPPGTLQADPAVIIEGHAQEAETASQIEHQKTGGQSESAPEPRVRRRRNHRAQGKANG